MPNWKAVIVHHSATPVGGRARWESIRRFHVDDRGWQDIGYNFGIGLESGEWVELEGRGEDRIGAHCPGQNSTALGVCLLGSFLIEPPEPGQLETACRLILRMCDRYGINELTQIYPHSHFRPTACPGLAWGALRGALDDAMDARDPF